MDPAGRLVVGAAVVRGGRVLAARRTGPGPSAGGWELPGGKVEPGEDEPTALVRELAEELGIGVRPEQPLGPRRPMANGYALQVWTARLTDGTPVPLQDHDAVRWLGPEQLGDVAWLAADQEALPAVREVLLGGDPLVGGRVGGTVEVAGTVRRPAGPWTPTVQALLAHLRREHVHGVPAPLGVDDRDREVVSFVDGDVVGTGDPPPRFRSDRVVAQVGRWLAGMHAASRSFVAPPAAPWRRGAIDLTPGRVVCHNDVSPYNIVLRGDRLAGVLDWDMAAPGSPLDDVAYVAWQFVLRWGHPVAEEARLLTVLADAYGVRTGLVLARVGPRLRGAVRAMHRGAAAGDPGMQTLLQTGIPAATEAGAAALRQRAPAIEAALRSS